MTDPEKFVYEDVAIAAYLLVRMCHPSSVEWGQVATNDAAGVGGAGGCRRCYQERVTPVSAITRAFRPLCHSCYTRDGF